MLENPLIKAVGIALFCGAIAFTATWVRRRQLTASEHTRRTATLTPLTAGLTAMVGLAWHSDFSAVAGLT